jgi:hypothetical protein
MNETSAELRKGVWTRWNDKKLSLENIFVESPVIGTFRVDVSVEEVPLDTLKPGADAGAFANEREFVERCLETSAVPCRIYSRGRGGVEVIVPEKYARQLDPMRELRRRLQTADYPEASHVRTELQDHPHGDRALPEDMFMLIDALPTKLEFSCVILQGDSNPYDLFFKTVYGDGFCSGADTYKFGGKVTFYRRSVDRFLAEELFHEWAHAHSAQFANRQMVRLFNLACAIEPHGDFSRAYAKQPGEALPVNLGEQIMGLSGPEAMTFAIAAPVRAAVLSRGLREALQAGVQMLEPSSLLERFVRRLDELDAETGPIARAMLVEAANDATDATIVAASAVLLAFVGTSDDMALLHRTETLDVSTIPVDAGVVHRIGCMPSLRRLDLSWTNLEGDWLRDLRMLPLEALAVSGLHLTNSHLIPVMRIPSLRSLDIRETLVNDDAVKLLSHGSLCFLDTRRSRMTDQGRQRVRDLLPEARVE